MIIGGRPHNKLSTVLCLCILISLWLTAGEVFVAKGQSSTLVEIPGTQWAARFDGPGNQNDVRPVMDFDADGHVYVAAETKSVTPGPAYAVESLSTDIVTIKYDRNGAQVWAAVFNGAGRYIDSPKDIGVDSQGNVFVTGYSWGGRTSDGGTDYDFVTIKYDANGNQKWVRHYRGRQAATIPQDMAFALDLDRSGNVYVTGGSYYNGVNDWLVMEFATVKYDTNGNQLWVRSFDSPDRAGAMPADVKVDAAGNVLVAGHFNYYVAATNTHASDFVLLKYDAAGVALHQERYDTPGPNSDDDDQPVRLHLDARGNAYILGVSYPSLGHENSTRSDIVLLKFSQDGRLAWDAVYTRPGETEEGGYDLVTDAAGNVYVAGVTDDRNLFVATLTLKYDPSGRLLWERVVDFTPEDMDLAIGLAMDPGQDRVHVGVVAIMESGGRHYDYAVVTYLANGTRAGVKAYDNPLHSDDGLRQIRADAEGNLYLAGTMSTVPGGTAPYDLLTVKVSPTTTAPTSEFAVSGAVTLNGVGLGGVKLTVTSTTAGFTPRTVTSAATTGAYSFGDLPAGRSYVVTPSSSGYAFTPRSRSYTNLAADKAGQNFAATRTYTISGSVTQGGSGLGGVKLTLTSTTSGFTPRVVTSASSTGAFAFTDLPAGRSYVVTPSSNIYTFTPASRTLSNLATNQAGQSFAVASRKTYSISGRVTRAGTTTGIGGVRMSLTNSSTGAVKAVTTLSDGSYSLTSIPAGFNYVLRPAKSGMTFTPAYRSYANLSASRPAGAGTAFTGN